MASLLFVAVFWAASPGFSEPAPQEPEPPAEPATPATPSVEPMVDRTIREAGFHEGALIFSLSGGPTLNAMNSFMSHERAYDRNLQVQIQEGNTPVALGSATYPGLSFASRYRMNPIIQFDYEKARFNHLGLGFSLFNFSVEADRQDVRPGFQTASPGTMVRRDYAFPYPQSAMLFQSSGALFQAVLHPLNETFIDPYVALRAGIEGHSGTAHSEVFSDPSRYDNRIRNGVGLVAGAGVGFNLYLSRYFGFKFEGTFLRQALHSDMYAGRTIDTTHFQMGIFVSMF